MCAVPNSFAIDSCIRAMTSRVKCRRWRHLTPSQPPIGSVASCSLSLPPPPPPHPLSFSLSPLSLPPLTLSSLSLSPLHTHAHARAHTHTHTHTRATRWRPFLFSAPRACYRRVKRNAWTAISWPVGLLALLGGSWFSGLAKRSELHAGGSLQQPSCNHCLHHFSPPSCQLSYRFSVLLRQQVCNHEVSKCAALSNAAMTPSLRWAAMRTTWMVH